MRLLWLLPTHIYWFRYLLNYNSFTRVQMFGGGSAVGKSLITHSCLKLLFVFIILTVASENGHKMNNKKIKRLTTDSCSSDDCGARSYI